MHRGWCSTPNVLFPFSLRDTLLRLSAQGLYHVVWSSQILDETTRNLVATSRMSVHQADRLRAAMERAFPEACVDDYTDWLAAALNAPHDRHVVACALRAWARYIVTFNLRDFEPLPAGLEACHPDGFLCDALEDAPGAVLEALRLQAAALKRPPVALDELLSGLGTTGPAFATAARRLHLREL